MQFEDCSLWVQLGHKLTLSMAIDYIMEYSNKGVLLLVNEIMKSGGKEEDIVMINRVVALIGECLDILTTQFKVVITTLNLLATDKETKSGRLIEWIMLAPPLLHEATSLFGNDAIDSPILRQCIADCNGHYCSLEALKMVWNKYKEKQFSYPMLIQELGRRMDRKYSQLRIFLTEKHCKVILWVWKTHLMVNKLMHSIWRRASISTPLVSLHTLFLESLPSNYYCMHWITLVQIRNPW
jgi:hypothetical protein